MSKGPHDRYTSKGAPEWCDDCGRAHTNAGAHVTDTPEDVLGLRGVASTIAYAWCERERAYHYTSRRRAQYAQPSPGRWTQNVAQPKRTVTVRALDRNYSAQYDAQRVTRSRAPMTRGGGNGILVESHPVALTDGARHALARVNRWSTVEGMLERTRDMHALMAKIDARETCA